MIAFTCFFGLAFVLLLACLPLWTLMAKDHAHAKARRRRTYEDAVKLTPAYRQNEAEKHSRTLAERKQALEYWQTLNVINPNQYRVVEGSIMAFPPLRAPKATGHVEVTEEKEATEPALLPAILPNYIRYEDVRAQVPPSHRLVGCDHTGVVTREQSIGACVWIVGGSGTGKTSSTVIRVDERVEAGSGLLCIDPHWFKDDSLSRAILPYSSSLLRPISEQAEEHLDVMRIFLDTFHRRKDGSIPKPWAPVTLLVDEVGSLMDVTGATNEEKDVALTLRRIARICGQEARNFNMGGMFISQQATDLSWLRKVATMIICHQLLMLNERLLACNNNNEIAKSMEFWPIGRTYVYGLGFQNGGMIVQQPYYKPVIVEAEAFPSHREKINGLYSAINGRETWLEADASEGSGNVSPFPDNTTIDAQKRVDTSKVGNETRGIIARMVAQKKSHREISETVGLGGKKYKVFKAVLDELELNDSMQQTEMEGTCS